MEETKTFKELIVALIVIVLVILLGVFYLIFGNKLFNKKSDDNTTTTVTTTTTTTTTKKVETDDDDDSGSVDRITEKSDSDVIFVYPDELLTEEEIKTELKDLKKEYKGMTFTFNCMLYEQDQFYGPDDEVKITDYYCQRASFKVDNYFGDEVLYGGTISNPIVIKTKDYYILTNEGCFGGTAYFEIYNSKGKKVLREENAATFRYDLYVRDNKLFFNTVKEIDADENIVDLYYKYIDLSKEKLVEEEIKKETVTDRPECS